MNGYLFDENLPRRIVFTPSRPVNHAMDVLGDGASDTMLWQHARANGLVIVTKDADFSARIMQTSPPPWVVHLCVGNMRLAAFHAWLAGVWPNIEMLLPAHKLIRVYLDRIESIRD